MSLALVRDLGRDAAAVRTRGVSKRFGKKTALDGLDLDVPEGAIYVLVGPNGAGKTTTLRALLDLVKPDQGSATVFGRSTSEDGPWVRSQIGYLADEQGLRYPKMRVGALLKHHASYYPTWDDQYASSLIEALEVDLDGRARGLSKGEARRAQLVMTLAHRPPLLLLDEPTDGLDPLARDRVLSLLADHAAANPTTILVSTHLTHELEGLGDCLGALVRGRLTAQLERSELEAKLHRIRAELGDGWQMPAELGESVIHARQARGEMDTVFWGDADELGRRLTASGATVRQVAGLNLEEATRALLSREMSR